MSAPSPRQKELDGRTAAVLAVADALAGRRFASEALRAWRSTGRLVGREAALAMEIAQGALRHILTIEQVLGAVAELKRERVKTRLRAILYTAAYQIIWLDHIPLFAAVDEAVELARWSVRGRAPAMVNAVLRRLTGTIAERRVPWRRLDPTQIRVTWDQACLFSVPVLPKPGESEDAALHLAAATGERAARYAGLAAQYGPAHAEALAWASQATPVTVLQRNTLRATPQVFEQSLRAVLGESVEFAAGAAFVPAHVSVLDLPVFADGLVFVQDTTAYAAALAVGARPGERVLDLCAAPGGKAVVLALQMNGEGEVVACDTAPERLARVTENVARLGLTCVRTRLLAAGAPELGPEAFDAALVDVPCSNTGVIARRPEARLGLTARKLRSLVAAQHQLLRRAAGRVRPGGRLVYSTCSLEPEENEQVVAAFLEESPQWQFDAAQTTLPAWGPRPADWRDGGYFARLIKGPSSEHA